MILTAEYTVSLLWCCNAASWRPSWTWWWPGCNHWSTPAGGGRDTPRNSWQLYRWNKGSTRKQNSLDNITKSQINILILRKSTLRDNKEQRNTQCCFKKTTKIWGSKWITFPCCTCPFHFMTEIFLLTLIVVRLNSNKSRFQIQVKKMFCQIFWNNV